MKTAFSAAVGFTLAIISLSCSREEKSKAANPASINNDSTKIVYAKGFTTRQDGDYKWVEVTYPYQGAASGYTYLLVPKGKSVPAHGPGVKVIETPITSIVCTSTTHIPLLDYLGATDRLTGFPTTDYISSEKMRKRIDEGKVMELGVDNGLNIEALVALKPDLLMAYTMSSDYGQFKKIEELGVPVIINAEYLEPHPLGRAEWIKFMALFLGKERMADSVFRSIEQQYLETHRLTEGLSAKPTAFSGVVYGDAWFLPGGKNYAARLMADAGYQYLWADDPSNGYLQIAFEKVFERAREADYWIGVGTFKSLEEINAADHRYANFNAFKNQHVFSYDARHGSKGGSEFLELGYLRPDIILKDLVKIAHPELLPEHELYFHRRLF